MEPSRRGCEECEKRRAGAWGGAWGSPVAAEMPPRPIAPDSCGMGGKECRSAQDTRPANTAGTSEIDRNAIFRPLR